jgi:hypothetical protein
MGITQDTIERELLAGFNIFCATCSFHHEALDKGLYSCIEKTCGGPLKGLSFPTYNGPIPRDRFKDICLLCGSPEDLKRAIYVQGQHIFSLCHKDRNAIEVLPSLNVTIHPIIAPLRDQV